MRRKKISQRIAGIILAIIGAIVIIEVMPLWIWYIMLGMLFLGLIVYIIL
ncbi:MAG: hypothetical protein GX285_10865 [Clostridiales bacterium]|nr:hypothetical protein [Clostridiales bacterium]